MKTLKKIVVYFIVIVFTGSGFGILLALYENGKQQHETDARKDAAEILFQQKKKTILWDGYAGKSFSVKITSYSKKGNMYLTGEEVIPDIVFAKLELWPTIGSMPTLLYVDSNSGQIKRITCSTAEII